MTQLTTNRRHPTCSAKLTKSAVCVYLTSSLHSLRSKPNQIFMRIIPIILSFYPILSCSVCSNSCMYSLTYPSMYRYAQQPLPIRTPMRCALHDPNLTLTLNSQPYLMYNFPKPPPPLTPHFIQIRCNPVQYIQYNPIHGPHSIQ